MKLSNAQIEIMENAKREIDKARQLDYPEWLVANGYYDDSEESLERAIARCYMKKYWEANRNGEVCTHCNSRSLKKLESLGLIEIVVDSIGNNYGIDHIRVLNY